MINEFSKFIDPIKRKVYLMIGRAILTAVKNTGKTQMIQVTGLKDETISDIERMQEYGFETYPKTDSEATINFINGNRDQGLIICVSDRRYRPTDLSEGEVRVYDYLGSKITLKKTGIIEMSGNAGTALEKIVLGETLKTWLEAHTHATPVGPSGPPTQAATLPTILSAGVKAN
jgi:phage baseplate assembly protein V